MGNYFNSVIKRSKETTVLVDDGFVETEAFVSLRAMQAAGGTLAFVLGLIALAYVLFQSQHVKRTPAQSYLFKLLLAHVAANIISNFHMMLLGTVYIYPKHWQLCSFLGSMPGPAYVTSHAFSNLIFLQRSKVVTKNMQGSITLRNTLRITTFGTYAMLLVVGACYVFLRGMLLPNNVCTHTYPWWAAIVVLVGDLSLATAFLILFVEPVRAQAKFLSEHAATAESSLKLMKIAKKNLYWGSISLATTFCFIWIVIIARIVLETNNDEVYAVYMLDWAFGPIETSANLLAALQLTAPVWRRNNKILSRGYKSSSSENHHVLQRLSFFPRSNTNNDLRRSSQLPSSLNWQPNRQSTARALSGPSQIRSGQSIKKSSSLLTSRAPSIKAIQ